jgi:hypothetical protein
MKKLGSIIQIISSWSDEEKLLFRKNVKPILDHNFNTIHHCDGDMDVANNIYNIVLNNKV